MKDIDGTYYYIVKYKPAGGTEVEKAGFVTLIR